MAGGNIFDEITSESTAELLVVEGDPTDRAALEDRCRTAFHPWRVTGVATLAEAITKLTDAPFDLVLLDLDLPDSHGIETFARLHTCAPRVPVLVLVPSDDEEALGRAAIERGAQDYLTKTAVDASLLSRAIRYALERARLQRELQRTRARQRRDAEIAGVERLSRGPGTSVTANLYSAARLRDASPAEFDRAVESYRALLEAALEHRVHKDTMDCGDALRDLSDRLGFVRGGPRDVIEIHTRAVRSLVANCSAARATAYVEESRLVLLELMGNLVAFYRTRITRNMEVAR